MFGIDIIKLRKKKKISARSSIGLERLTTDQEVGSSSLPGRTIFII